MSKDLPDSNEAPKKNGLKKLAHARINITENGVNFLSSNILNHFQPNQTDGRSPHSNDSVSCNSKSVHTYQRHFNGVQLNVASKGCKDLLKIHRCSSDGKLVDFDDEDNEGVISKSMSSSDSCMNGSSSSGSTDEARDMAGRDDKCNGGDIQENYQMDEKNAKNYSPSKTKKGTAASGSKVMIPSSEDNTVKDNDVVRPKTWSRKLVEKSKLRKDGGEKGSTKNNTQVHNCEKISAVKQMTRDRTCKIFEHDRKLIQEQRSSQINGNSEAHCSVIEILPNDGESDPFLDNDSLEANGELETRSNNVQCQKSVTESNVETSCNVSNADIPALIVAPLAEPEDISDDEIGACYSSSTGNDSARTTSDCKSTSDQFEYECNENNLELRSSESLSEPDAMTDKTFDQTLNGSQTDPSRTFGVYPESIFSRAPDEDDCSLSFGYSSPLSNTVSGASPSCDTVTMLEKQTVIGNDAMNVNAQNLQQVSSASMDSLEEIGDYIETDLPPNRLAFFSRGSSSSTTTEEDEGCGDEVLPNNDEESDNETIDPLNSYHNPGLPNLPDVQYNNQPLSFSMNLNSERCQNSNFRSDNWGRIPRNFLGNSVVPSRLVRSAPSCDNQYDGDFDALIRRSSLENHRHENESLTSFSNTNVGSQHSDLRCENSENVPQENSRIIKLPNTNSRNLNDGAVFGGELDGNHDRLSSVDENVRHSSSESEAAGILYMISDDSENVSPEFESGMEYVFPSIGMSASFSGGTYPHQQQSFVFGDPSVNPRNHSASLDFDREEEILHCPFFVRRARSLDQEIDTRCRPQNRLSDVDAPNIPVASCNLQHDEINQNQKVFEKSAFEVMAPLPTWDSSDEDENNRVPDTESVEEEPLDQIFESMENQLTNRQGEAMNRLSSEFPASNISVPEDEPIYEEIDDLLVLMDEICSEGEPDNLQPVCNAISKLRRKRRHRSPVSDVEKVMIWNEYEAYVVQVKQIGTSACGPTAVLNVLKAFDFQVEKEEVCQTITSNMRMEAAPIPYYLFSRSTAGTTAQALVEGVAGVTRGAIKGRFFHFYPQRDVELMKWLGHWMKKGAVPVATLNLQRGVKPGWTIPDAWHHQMVYGVSSKGVYLTNPLEIVPENVIMDQLTSDSVLLVRRHDVISRFRDWCPLNEILKQRDLRWRTMNVLGQVVHMLRESMVPQEQIQGARAQMMSHISIPAVYKAGIILFMRANTETYEELLGAPELPLKQTSNTKSS